MCKGWVSGLGVTTVMVSLSCGSKNCMLETGPFPTRVVEQVELTLAVHHSDNPPTKELRAHSSIS